MLACTHAGFQIETKHTRYKMRMWSSTIMQNRYERLSHLHAQEIACAAHCMHTLTSCTQTNIHKWHCSISVPSSWLRIFEMKKAGMAARRIRDMCSLYALGTALANSILRRSSATQVTLLKKC